MSDTDTPRGFTMRVRGAVGSAVLSDRWCRDCATSYEASLVDHAAPHACPGCGSLETERRIGTATLPHVVVPGNSDFAERQRERLEKRSDYHFHHMGGKDEAIAKRDEVMKRFVSAP